jgi:NitT/TauT family transport system permease protein/sulfonate transport system permease protein
MAILWFGIGERSIYFIIFMSGFSHLVINTYAGAIRVDHELIGVAEMLGANKRQIFINVVLPSCIPFVFAGLHFALSTSWMAVLAAEMIASTRGSGWIIVAGMESGDIAQIFVGIICIAVVGLLLATIMRTIERRICVWYVKGT